MLTIFLFTTCLATTVIASLGDNSNEYRGCYHICHFNNCTTDKNLNEFEASRSIAETLMLWSCEDECRYNCMWQATYIFVQRRASVPQFFGKWPFIRWLGMQEPASAIFSLLNLASHLIGLRRFRREVPPSAPLYQLWIVYAMICINAWFWSFIFHCRDRGWTELLDYFCAFSMVLFTFYALIVRIIGVGKEVHRRVIGGAFLLFFLYHVWYLTMRYFDYGYNMKVNVFIGLMNGIGWLIWAVPLWQSRAYVHDCVYTMVALAASLCLELADFSPIGWLFDAHALWHLATAPLPFMWYRFLQQDCLFMLTENSSSRSDFRKRL